MKKGSNKRGNIFDLFLIFLFVFCVLGVFFRWFSLRQKTPADPSALITAQLVVRGVDPRMVDSLTVGERLYSNAGDDFGELVEVSLRPAKIELLRDGTAVEGEWDPALRCDLFLTVRFLGTQTGGRVLHGARIPLSVGQHLTCYSERAEISAVILSIVAHLD